MGGGRLFHMQLPTNLQSPADVMVPKHQLTTVKVMQFIYSKLSLITTVSQEYTTLKV